MKKSAFFQTKNIHLKNNLMTTKIKFPIFIMLFIITELVTAQQPYIRGNTGMDQFVKNSRWQRVNYLSDEFNRGNSQNVGGNWLDIPQSNGFNWIGRPPVRFYASNAKIVNNQLWLVGTRNGGAAGNANGNANRFTHGGAIVRSRFAVTPGMYTEARMRTANTFMSGTFWLVNKPGCQVPVFTELDVTESIGRNTGRSRPGSNTSGHANTRNQFTKGMNSNVQRRSRTGSCSQSGASRVRFAGNYEADGNFHIYGTYWESPTRIHFFSDGFYVNSVTNPAQNLSSPMHISMALESYNFNWPTYNNNTDGMNLGEWARATKYDWVRTYRRTGGKDLTSVTAESLELNFTISPNPATDTIQIDGTLGEANVKIYGLDGKEVIETTTESPINISGLNSGVYIVEAFGKSKKFVKK